MSSPLKIDTHKGMESASKLPKKDGDHSVLRRDKTINQLAVPLLAHIWSFLDVKQAFSSIRTCTQFEKALKHWCQVVRVVDLGTSFGLKELDGAFFAAKVATFPQLTDLSLVLSEPSKIRVHKLKEQAHHFKSYEQAIARICTNHPRISRLSIREDRLNVALHFPKAWGAHLESLRITNVNTAYARQMLQDCPKLQELRFKPTDYAEYSLSALEIPQLVELQTNNLTSEGIKILVNHCQKPESRLVKLKITYGFGKVIDTEDLVRLQACKKLRYLELKFCDSTVNDYPRFTSEAVEGLIKALPNTSLFVSFGETEFIKLEFKEWLPTLLQRKKEFQDEWRRKTSQGSPFNNGWYGPLFL